MALKNLTKFSLIHYLRLPFTPHLDLVNVKFLSNHVIPSLNLTIRGCTCFFRLWLVRAEMNPSFCS